MWWFFRKPIAPVPASGPSEPPPYNEMTKPVAPKDPEDPKGPTPADKWAQFVLEKRARIEGEKVALMDQVIDKFIAITDKRVEAEGTLPKFGLVNWTEADDSKIRTEFWCLPKDLDVVIHLPDLAKWDPTLLDPASDFKRTGKFKTRIEERTGLMAAQFDVEHYRPHYCLQVKLDLAPQGSKTDSTPIGHEPCLQPIQARASK